MLGKLEPESNIFISLIQGYSHLFPIKMCQVAQFQWCVLLGLYSRCLLTGYSKKGTLFLLILHSPTSRLVQGMHVGMCPCPLIYRPEVEREGARWMNRVEGRATAKTLQGRSVPSMSESEIQ